ncbi:hypothetical protein V498_08303 [Pseudogymnoascus sp. VKM F-4517 (FW-2822)]|nr:hypothetical protein V498_08303 [Pseudogymnoascus sp. VKM F-4517 (FW-2822)]
MEPPRWPPATRQATAAQRAKLLPPNHITTDLSPKATFTPQDSQPDGCVTPTPQDEMSWEGQVNQESRDSSTFQIDLAECVETKTVTTTTTTKRSYPPLFVRPPLPLESLDLKQYPLARKSTPEAISSFSYEVNGEVVHFREDRKPSSSASPSSSRPRPPPTLQSRGLASLRAYETPDTTRSSRRFQNADENSQSYLSRRLPTNPRSPDSLLRLSGAPRRQSSLEQPPLDAHCSSFPHRMVSSTRRSSFNPALLSTPDTGHRETSPLQTQLTSSITESTLNSSFEEATSPSLTASQGSFPSATATPPIAESDLEPFAPLNDDSAGPSVLRSSVSAGGATHGASLPSPSLSPTLAAANLHNAQLVVRDDPESQGSGNTLLSATAESKSTFESPDHANEQFSLTSAPQRNAMDVTSMLENFDSMPSEMKTFMMYQFLRRCNRKTLHVIAGVVNPALKCDFLEELPTELSLQILSFLDHRDRCRAAQVSKRWRDINDTNEAGWKELIERDRFVLPEGEVERAIREGWGWQDPYGPDGCEKDLSQRPGSSDLDSIPTATRSHAGHSGSLRQGGKRKRAHINYGPERSKRRAVSAEVKERPRHTSLASKYHSSARRSEGPNAAATAAALAVPAPEIGLPSLRKLHLYKSLYRRHFMLQRSWMSGGKVAPRHVAFPAHPRHVITCLQFDDDKIITGSDDTFIHIYDTKTGALRKRLTGHDGGVWALQYEGNVLVSGSTDRSVRVWDIEKGLCTQIFHGHTSTVRCLQILMPLDTGKVYNDRPVMVPEKPLIITGSRDAQLRVWRLPEQGSKKYLAAGPPANDSDCPYYVRTLQGHTSSVRAIAAHEDTLVSGSYDSSVRVWKISTGESVHQLRGHIQKVYSVVLDHKRKRCISGSMDNTVKIWSLETGMCLFTLDGHSSLVGLLDLKDERLVSAAADSTLRIWDPENGQCKNTLTAHTGAITCFQHDGNKVVSGSDRTLKMWNVKTGECIQDLLTDLSGVWQVKFDERRCVAAVQREGFTFIEILDFGASRDGVPAEDRNNRILLQPSEYDRITEDDEVVA